MKKSFFAIVLSLALVVLTTFQVFAASASCSASSTVKEGDTITFTFSVNQTAVKSGSVDISYDSNYFELVSGAWQFGSAAPLADYSGSRGVFSLSSATDLNNTAVFKLTLKAKAAVKSTTVKANFTLKNTDGDTLGTASASKSVQIICKSHSFGAWDTKEATCTADGSKTRTCSVCGTTEKETIKATGHQVPSYKTTKEATCTASGTKSGTCSVCNAIVSQTIAAKGHDFGEWTVKTASTCVEKGQDERICATCGATETRTAELAEHTYSEVKVTTEPTCTEIGARTKTCAVCGDVVSEEIPANGHDYGAWVTVTPSSCSVAGTEVATCKVCGAEDTRDAELASHDFGTELTVEREATISVPGLVSGTCVNCGARTEQETPCSVTDKATGVVITANEGTYRVGTEIEVGKEEAESEKTAAVAALLENTTDKFEIYNIAAKADGAKAAPNGTTTVTLPVPEGSSSVIGAMLVKEDGTTEMLGAQLAEDGKTVDIAANELGTVVLMDLNPERPEPERSFSVPQTAVLAGGCSVVTLPIGFILGRASKRNKKKEEE